MTDPYPQDPDWTEEDEAYARWEEQRLPPLTPEEEFDLLFEAWQSGAEDREVCTTLALLAGTIEACPQCRSMHHLAEGTRRECRVCATQWCVQERTTNDEADGVNTGLVSPTRTTQHVQPVEQDT